MAKRFRTLRSRTKVAIALSLVFLLTWKMSTQLFTIVQYNRTNNTRLMLFGKGSISFNSVSFKREDIKDRFEFYWNWHREIMWLPSMDFVNGVGWSILIPLWCFAPFILIPTYLLWLKDRRIPEGHCEECGYNLTGNVSGKCSECGTEVAH